jgi:hypothetical protein
MFIRLNLIIREFCSETMEKNQSPDQTRTKQITQTVDVHMDSTSKGGGRFQNQGSELAEMLHAM